jgi:hypothetical protein
VQTPQISEAPLPEAAEAPLCTQSRATQARQHPVANDARGGPGKGRGGEEVDGEGQGVGQEAAGEEGRKGDRQGGLVGAREREEREGVVTLMGGVQFVQQVLQAVARVRID